MEGVIRTVVLACGLSLALAVPAVAAPTWAPSTPLSGTGNTVAFKPSIAIADGGFAIEAWAETIGGKSVIRVAQHAPGGSWATLPGDISSSLPGDGCTPFASIDATGNALVSWTQWAGPGCGVGSQTILFATRAANAASWSGPGVIGPAATSADWQTMAASNAAGQMVVAWETKDATNKYVFAAVGNPTTGFASAAKLTTSPIADAVSLYYLTAAIGPSNDAAAVQWAASTSTTSNIFISVHPHGGAFPATATALTTNGSGTSASEGTIAIDAAGDVLSAYEAFDGTTASFASRIQPAANGTWQPPQTIAIPQPGYSASWVAVGFDAGGTATAAWVETNFTPPIPHPRRVFSATRPAGVAGTWIGQTPITDVLPSLDNVVTLAEAPSGAVAISWGTEAPQDSAQALYRPAGGAFSALTAVGASQTAGPGASVAIAPSGDAAISFIGPSHEARVTTLDASPPVIASVSVPAAATTGQTVAMTASASDAWSGLAAGQPTWAFGDGGTGAGASVSHAFAAPGTFTVTIGAKDALGNAAAAVTRQIVVSNAKGAPPPPPPGSGAPTTIASAKLKATWKASHLVGSVSVSGTVGANTTLTLSIRRHGGKKTVAKSTFKAKAGKWTHSVTLPPSLAPGLYDVFVTGSGVKTSQRSFTIAAPKTGIVKRNYATGPRRGPEATTLSGTSELWAHFIFGTLPKKGQTITTQWILPNGSKLAANTRPRTTLVEAQVKDLSGKPLPTGRWRCVISAGGVVVATLSVRLR